MGTTGKILARVRSDLAPTDKYLGEARNRRKVVNNAALSFEGTNRKYASGSIAHGTANKNADADGGVVLDRRSRGDLGPDGDNEGPEVVVHQVREHIRPLVRKTYSDARFRLKKRAIKVTPNSPVDGEDPTVDLIVALERRDEPGLWIPNLDRNDWDASHPEKHTEIFTAGPKSLRRVRAQVTRLAKGWNHQYGEGREALSSFHIETLVWECIEVDMTVAEGLEEFFDHSARELEKDDTNDPADVSGPIRLQLDRATAVDRLKNAAGLMHEAFEAEAAGDDDVVREALAELYWKNVDPPKGSTSKAAWAAGLRTDNSGVGLSKTGLALGTGVVAKNTRSSGDAER